MMKTKSTGYLVLLTNGNYRGFWLEHNVTVPFSSEEIMFDVEEYTVKQLEVKIQVQDGVAYVETI